MGSHLGAPFTPRGVPCPPPTGMLLRELGGSVFGSFAAVTGSVSLSRRGEGAGVGDEAVSAERLLDSGH